METKLGHEYEIYLELLALAKKAKNIELEGREVVTWEEESYPYGDGTAEEIFWITAEDEEVNDAYRMLAWDLRDLADEWAKNFTFEEEKI